MQKYERLLEEYIFEKAKRVLKEPYKKIKYPFIDPGEGYNGNLWDWDSFWTAYALCRAYELYGEMRFLKAEISKEKLALHIRGCVLNFLSAQADDGFVPIMMTGDGDFCDFFETEHQKGTPLNQIKPFLCQAIVNASEFSGDYAWFDVEKAIKYLLYYEKYQRDEGTGLFIWQDDIMIGVDNNPTVFFRPPRSSADIYLNCFMVAEYDALISILTALKDNRVTVWREKKASLIRAINAYAWDERDGIYYTQDVGFHKTILKAGNFEFHKNLAPKWKTVPIKIRFWGCFLPLFVGVCDEERAKKLVLHLQDERVFARYGVRTLASDEPMYDLEKSSNPSNWLGAIWTIANYCVWKGLKRYGFNALAEKLRVATIELLGKKLEEKGDLFESYQPDTGEENLHAGFLSWNLLVLEMIKAREDKRDE
ncbi:MAG: trehalase / alfa-L-rhamnosidase / mannosyl oligosaccharide glucosidase [Clostridia bacterium]|nr:trehalase / alfa-L-rhamnosidase / mannosyl oligosaccharide glucosidase [Clostridia bacterium]